MYYMVGGSSKINQENGMKWLRNHPDESRKLLDLLTTVVIDYLSAQVDNGADMLQVFEAMGMFIDEDLFHEWAMPCMDRIASELKIRHPDIPLMAFPRGASYALVDCQEAGYDVVTLDTQAPRKETRQILQDSFNKGSANNPMMNRPSSVQGNLDVKYLQPGTTAEELRDQVNKMLDDFGPQGLIANLGEGLQGKEDPVLVDAFINTVHELSAVKIKEGLKNQRAEDFGGA